MMYQMVYHIWSHILTRVKKDIQPQMNFVLCVNQMEVCLLLYHQTVQVSCCFRKLGKVDIKSSNEEQGISTALKDKTKE